MELSGMPSLVVHNTFSDIRKYFRSHTLVSTCTMSCYAVRLAT